MWVSRDELANAVGALGDTNREKLLLEEVLAIQEAHYGTRHHVEVARTFGDLVNAVGDL
jgi:hypothetical protein